MAFELGGSIILKDLFSASLAKLSAGGKQVDATFDQVGDSVDAAALSAKQGLAELRREMDRIQQAARKTGDISVGDLARYRELSGAVRATGSDMDDLFGKTQRTGGVMETLGKVTLVTATAFGALRTAAGVVDLAKVAAQAEAVETSFNSLTDGLGVNGQKLVSDLEAASRGAVDQITLLRVANRALLAGGAEMAEQLPDILRAARAASLATGQDIQFVFDTLTKGIVKASPLLIDNAEVYIQVGASVDEYARGLGKATEELTFQERKLAISNAVMQQTIGLEQRLGIEATTAAEEIVTLSVAIDEVKRAGGELLNIAGLPEFFANLAKSLRSSIDLGETTDALDDVRRQLEAIGDERALASLDQQIATLQRAQAAAGAGIFPSQDKIMAARLAYITALGDVVAGYETYIAARRAAENPELAAYQRQRDLAEAASALSEEEQAAAAASSAFAAALSEANREAGGLEATAQSLAGIVAGLKDLAGLTPKIPQLSTLFGTDTNAIRAYLAEVERIAPEQAGAISQVRQWVDAFEDYREAIIGNALELGDNREALERLAQSFPEFGGDVAGLVENFDKLPPVIQGIVQGLGGFGYAFEDAVDKATAKLSGIDAVKAKLESAAATFQTLASIPVGALQTPELPKDLSFDPQPWREYLETIRSTYGAASNEYVQTTQRMLTALEEQQQAVAQAALGIDDYGARLDYLAGAILGPAASTEDLLAAVDRLPPALQAAIDPTLSLADAVERLQAAAARPVTIGVRVAGLESTLAQVDSLALRLVGVLDPTKIRTFRDRMRLDAEKFWTSTNATDEFNLRLQQEQWLNTQEGIVRGYTDGYRQIEKAATQTTDRLAGSASELKGRIEGALRDGLGVTQLDFDLTAGGEYEDKALESARRLAAIAERGFGELSAHPDWAGMLKIPPEVLSGSEAALKSWAASTQAQVEALARPDLINWDAFIENFRSRLDQEAAQELTIDIAVEKLDAAGLLEGSAEERRKAVAEALGLEMPSMTIEALFETQEGARGALLNDIYQGDDALPVLVRPEWVTAADSPSGVDPSALERPEPYLPELNLPTGVDLGLDPALLDAQGREAGDALMFGFVDTMTTTPVGAPTLQAWATDFAGNAPLFTAVGTSLGKTVSGGFMEAMEQSVGSVRRRIAELVAPEVAVILNRKNNGAMP